MKKKIKHEENNTFFMFIGDLMTGLLFIFILLFLREYLTSNADSYKKLLEEYKILKEKEEQFNKISVENEILKIENDKYKKQDKKIEEIYEKIETKLKNSIKDNPYVKIDTYRQELILDDSVLFDVGQSELKDEGKEALRKVLPKFFSIFLDEKDVLNYLEQLIIEGHTDDTGPGTPQQNYLFNLNLSQQRALEVVNFIYQDEMLTHLLKPERLKKLRIYLSSNGKSNSELIYSKNSNGQKVVDRAKSRRVTIKYKLDIQKIRGVNKREGYDQ